jgi:hypothetical protein
MCVGCIELLINNGRVLVSTVPFFLYTLLMLLFGQRLAKDDGARTIVIYFIPQY